jgi:large subunit ribosomal protein L6
MSRVGKLPVEIPSDVQVDLSEDSIKIKGKLGELTTDLVSGVKVEHAENKVVVAPANNSKQARSLWGTYRSIIANMVEGVSNGFEIRLEINGVGYRAAMDGKILTLTLGYSHEIKYAVSEDINIKCEKPTILVISGADKQKVGQVAGELMKLRPVEPYKGKGVYKEGAYIRRKEGKKK